MNISCAKDVIKSDRLNCEFELLYRDINSARNRYLNACENFLSIFGDRDNIRVFSAPGRTEVGGNHTDHQRGRVLAGSVDLDIIGIVSANNDGIIRIKSDGYDLDQINLNELYINPHEVGQAASLIRGICANLNKLGYSIGGFDAYTTSNVIKGSGLSSSAAFEVFICTVLNFLYNNGNINPLDVAIISHKAERDYFGKPCGLLDQTACSLGGFTAIDFYNPCSPIIEKIDFDIEKSGYTLCVVDTGGNHANLTQDYTDITVECGYISKYFNKDFLRDVDPDNFFKNIPVLREKFGDRAVLRAIHFFNEDVRANEEKYALKNGDFKTFLNLVNESGNSSYKYLQNVYSISSVKEQGISLGLALSEDFLKGRGACRVHGGGFAGTIQAFVPNDIIAEFKVMIEHVFGQGSCHILKIRSVGGYEITL